MTQFPLLLNWPWGQVEAWSHVHFTKFGDVPVGHIQEQIPDVIDDGPKIKNIVFGHINN